MLMQSAEFPVGARAFIREHVPKWHGWVWKGCTTGRASYHDGSRSSDDALHWAMTSPMQAAMGHFWTTMDKQLAPTGNASCNDMYAIF